MVKAFHLMIIVLVAAVAGQLARNCTQDFDAPQSAGLSHRPLAEIIPGWDALSPDERKDLETMMQSPEVRTPADGFALMQSHTAAGLLRLSDEELLIRAELLATSLERAPTATCARVGGGLEAGVGVSDVQEILVYCC